MINERFVEIRDAGTTIPAIAFRIQPSCPREILMMARAGYGKDFKANLSYVFLMQLDGCTLRDDPFDWSSGSRTMKLAHFILSGPMYTRGIEELQQDRIKGLSLDELLEHDRPAIIDIEYALGEKDTIKATEFGE